MTIPPIVARGVLLDIAAARNVAELPAHYAITPADIDAALARAEDRSCSRATSC